MANFKVIISDAKTGKSEVKELKDPEARVLVGAKIGDVLEGTVFGINGKVKITGGSDGAGFPMRSDVRGGAKKKILLSSGPGFLKRTGGERRRKLVRGNTITEEIFQVNAVLV